MIKKWENLTRDEIAALDKDKSIVLLPTSATEQHGAHLPVGTDAIILSTLVDKMVEECEFDAGNLIFAPQLNVGKSNEHMGFAVYQRTDFDEQGNAYPLLYMKRN